MWYVLAFSCFFVLLELFCWNILSLSDHIENIEPFSLLNCERVIYLQKVILFSVVGSVLGSFNDSSVKINAKKLFCT